MPHDSRVHCWRAAIVGFGILIAFCGFSFWKCGYDCPLSEVYLEAKRKIKVGMDIEEAKKLMPSGYLDVDPSPESGVHSRSLFSQEFETIDCKTSLVVEHSNGRVTKVTLSQFNDFSHHYWEVD